MTTEQKFNCIFCKDTFENKEELQDHFRKHGDPKYKTKTRFETQLPDEKSKEKTEMVSCDVCSKMFPTISKAITHKHKVHPDHDAKYFCQWCGKLFTMKHLYNVHVQSSHSNQDKPDEKCFHCDSCDVDFFLPSAMLYHNKFFHRQDTDLPDVGQSKKLKLCNQEVVPIYYCAFCGEEYDNKVNLFKHMTDDHADENQSPEEVLKCPLCEAVFFHLDAYEVHLTFHTPDDMYSVQNDALGEVLDYSLETVPPIIEKVESIEMEPQQDTDPESTINAVGIEKFLELAMGQPDDSPVKVKKHKKHKKSKKAAITLDEFLSMNQDVFGEGLDFQGIEEVPTQVVKNQLRYKKKPINPTNSVTLSDLEKLKNAGIVVKKKVGRYPVVNNLKATLSKPGMSNEKIFKVNPERELKTSSEVLTKLMNQSNNQIKIIKKSSSDKVSQEQSMPEDESIDEGKPPCEDTDAGKDPEEEPCTSSQSIAAIPSKVNSPNNEDQVKDKSSPNSPIPTEDNPEDRLSNKNESINNDEEDKTDFESPSNNEEAPEIPQDADIRSQEEDHIRNKITTKAIAEETDLNEPENQFSDTELDEKHDELDSTENHEDDMNGDKNEGTSDNNEQPNIKISAGASLSKLQHLSHLITVKPVSHSKMTTPVERDKKSQIPNHQATPQLNSPSEKSNINKPKVQAEKDPTIDALKNLSKNITIKSLSAKRSVPENVGESHEFGEAEGSNNIIDKNVMSKKIKVEIDESFDKSIVNSSNSPGKTLINKSGLGIKPNRTIVENVESSNANLLKRLTNITSKSLSHKKMNTNPQPVKQPFLGKKVVQAQNKPEEIIEIFDVDDSEDELENNSRTKIEPSQNSATSMDALKNLSKNITIKSNRQQPMTKSMKLVNDIKIEKQNEDSSNNYKDDTNVEALINIQNRNMAHVLKGLCKNITIKQGNSQKNVPCPDTTNNTQDTKVPEDNGTSDSDSYPGNVKITEMEHDMSENEDNEETLEQSTTQQDEPIVETPYDSASDKDDMEDFDDPQDFETEIKSSTVQKSHETFSSSSVNTVCLNNLRNISKNLTIKSLNPRSSNKEESSKTVQNQEHFVATQSKQQQPLRINKQAMKEYQDNNVATSKNSKDSSQFADRSTNSMHHKVSAMNQVNTVNKQVTVKTFQSKTVIQEITTTVTKTIKTVNQTVKQELRTNHQSNGPVIPQKIIGMRPNQTKNLQGVVVRHATPNVAIRANNALAQIRPAGTVVRQSKPNISMKTGTYSPRPNNPRMTVAKQVATPPSLNKPIGKSIKISPTAVISGVSKRPNTEDVSGPFSCFKKPKESLIPVSDIPTYTNSGESPAHFTAASHTSSSNTTNTKIVKGNSVVTAKQVKSQVNASMQQFSRVNNNTGLKIMSSQAKQTQVQEKTESSAMKRTTLEAIQRLQKQGLLVKKPRSDMNEGSRSSNHEGEESPEETDE